MTITQAIIQSVVEGLTEFLPISSTAHMKFVNPMIGVDPNDDFSKLFDIVIQLPAILAVVVLYWRKFFDFSRFTFYLKLIVAVIPALIFGALLNKYIDRALDNLYCRGLQDRLFPGLIDPVAGGKPQRFNHRWRDDPEAHP
jgi:undecaprenyl-diphosphatase